MLYRQLINCLKIILLSAGFQLLFIACNPQSNDLQTLTGTPVQNITNTTGTPAPNTARLRIFTLAGSTSVGAQTLTLNDTIDLRAVLVDDTGALLTEVAVQWWVSGSLNNDDLIVTGGNPNKYSTFDALTPGSGLIHATLLDTELITTYNVANNTTSTGNFSISSNLAADTIIVSSGNNQSGQVGSTLALPIKVRVLTTGLLPVPGKSVTFAATAGGGMIVTAQPVVTDSDGYAEAMVKVGGVVGVANNSYTASMSGGSVSTANFSATSTPGSAFSLSFTTQPGGANLNSVFSSQPVIVVKDSYGNTVTSATTAILISTSTGTGVVGGTTTINAVAGIATFTDLTYSVSENNVVLTASAGGLVSATSNAFNVGNVTATAQCNGGIAGWQTGEGGCRDMTNGLVWSAISVGTNTWHQAAWDSIATANAPEAWETALGIQYDVVGYPHPTATDGNLSAYCHDLVESGYSDWRLSSVTEVYAAYIASADLALQNAATNIWTGSYSNVTPLCTGTANNKCRANLSTGATLTVAAVTALNVRCVRRPVATKVIFTREPAAATRGFGKNSIFETQPIVKIVDSQNMVVSNSTVTVTLTAIDGTGALLGSTSVNAVAGVATFTNLYYNKAETIRLQATSGVLTPATTSSFSVQQQLPFALCQSTASPVYFVNGNGGCKDKTTGMIFSAPSISNVASWHAYVWDDVALGTADEDVDDNGRSNDNDTVYPPLANTDISTTNYCHDLEESGYTDWQAADYNTLSSITTKLPTQSVNFHSLQMWTAGTVQATPLNGYVYANTNVMTSIAKATATYRAVCVRQDPPTELIFTTQPSGGASGFGAGIIWTTQPVVKIRDDQGAVMRLRNDAVTLTVLKSDGTAATGNLWVNNVNMGSTVTVNAVNGIATFSNISYDNPNETIKLRASILAINWKGNVLNIPDEDSNAFNIPAQFALSLCQAGGAWASQNGGCQDLGAGGKVWTHVISAAKSWHQIVWDSTLGGSDAADAFDGASTDDYDAGGMPDLITPSGTDIDSESVCHSLRLNGFSDWKTPTYSQMNVALTAAGRVGYTRIYKNGATYIWSSISKAGALTTSDRFTITTGVWASAVVKTTVYGAICVRTP